LSNEVINLTADTSLFRISFEFLCVFALSNAVSRMKEMKNTMVRKEIGWK